MSNLHDDHSPKQFIKLLRLFEFLLEMPQKKTQLKIKLDARAP